MKKANIIEKTERYRDMLKRAIKDIEICISNETTLLYKFGIETKIMAKSYYDDGVYFLTNGDYVNALACFSYGYGWIDSGVRFGIFSIEDSSLFSI